MTNVATPELERIMEVTGLISLHYLKLVRTMSIVF